MIAAFLYLRIVATMYMGDDDESAPVGDRVGVPVAAGIALVVCLVVTDRRRRLAGALTEAARDAVPVLSALP